MGERQRRVGDHLDEGPIPFLKRKPSPLYEPCPRPTGKKKSRKELSAFSEARGKFARPFSGAKPVDGSKHGSVGGGEWVNYEGRKGGWLLRGSAVRTTIRNSWRDNFGNGLSAGQICRRREKIDWEKEHRWETGRTSTQPQP